MGLPRKHKGEMRKSQLKGALARYFGVAVHVEGTSNMVTQTSETDPALTQNGNFAALMQAINGCQAALTTKIDSLQIQMGLLRKDYEKICRRVYEAERHVGDTEKTVTDHPAYCPG